MKEQIACEFESEVLAAAIETRWPDGAGEELRTHAARCPICAEIAMVTCSIQADREELRAAVAVPDSARIWRLAQLRARREAVAAAGRPITIVQMIVFACATGLLGACFGATSRWFQSGLARIVSSPAAASIAGHVLLAAGGAAVLLLLPALLYFAMEKEARNASIICSPSSVEPADRR